MQTKDALYHATHDYKGGVDALAARMGIASSTLRCMANPNDDTHAWPLKRVQQLVALTGDVRPIAALASEAGGVFIPMPKAGGKPSEVMRDLAELAREFGDVPRETLDALADDRLTLKEFERIRDQVTELQASAATLMAHLAGMVETRPIMRLAK